MVAVVAAVAEVLVRQRPVLQPFPVLPRRSEVLLLQPPLDRGAVQVVPVPRRRQVPRLLLLSI